MSTYSLAVLLIIFSIYVGQRVVHLQTYPRAGMFALIKNTLNNAVNQSTYGQRCTVPCCIKFQNLCINIQCLIWLIQHNRL